MPTDLYRKTMEWAEAKMSKSGALMHKVWDGTPWMCEAFTGRVSDDLDIEIREWCRENFGPEAWPVHGKPGDWHRGGATVDGWTWFGFRTEEQMKRFQEAWPAPAKAA